MGKKTCIGFIVLGFAMMVVVPLVIFKTAIFNLLGPNWTVGIVLISSIIGAFVLCWAVDKLAETPKTQPPKASKVGPKKFKDPWIEVPKPEETEKKETEDEPPKVWEEKTLKRA